MAVNMLLQIRSMVCHKNNITDHTAESMEQKKIDCLTLKALNAQEKIMPLYHEIHPYTSPMH